MLYQSRYYQDDAVDSVFSYLSGAQPGNPLVALPTGTGKSIVIARIIKQAMERWPEIRIAALTHAKELIEQNSNKLKEIWPSAPFGINSASLKRRDVDLPIVFCGIKSVVKHVEKLGPRHLVLIDEAHLLNPKLGSMYREYITQNNKLTNSIIIGTTATPYRTGQGLLTDNGIFTDIVCDWTSLDKFNQLLRDGFLAPLIPRATNVRYDVSNIPLGSDGDFNQEALENSLNVDELNYKVCSEMVAGGYNRQCWIVFASGIKHAENIAAILRSMGINSAAIHSKNHKMRNELIEDYKSGKLRCLVGNNILTTGFDHPPIDFVGMLRATMSPGLWVQMLGRATRPSPETGKINGLVYDFAGNTERLGPINDPVIPHRKGDGAPGVAPVKICPNCGVYNHSTAKNCINCGYVFPVNTFLMPQAGTKELIKTFVPEYVWHDIDRVIYRRYAPPGKPPMLKATYVSQKHSFDEYILLEHTGGIRHKAIAWWKERMGSNEAPPTVDEAMLWTNKLKVPKRIKVIENRKFKEIVEQEF